MGKGGGVAGGRLAKPAGVIKTFDEAGGEPTKPAGVLPIRATCPDIVEAYHANETESE